MNNCHKELVWLVNTRLKPVNRPINESTSLGLYLSRAQPLKKANMPPSIRLVEVIAEVAARVKLNSLSIELKNRPKEEYTPDRVAWMINKAITTTQP